jgi:hypothetical protein
MAALVSCDIIKGAAPPEPDVKAGDDMRAFTTTAQVVSRVCKASVGGLVLYGYPGDFSLVHKCGLFAYLKNSHVQRCFGSGCNALPDALSRKRIQA